ncbi:MAG: hypothetical protein ACFB50_12420 [Rubrobacteraceae bacterium]
MGFEDSALTRLRRYRGEADHSLALIREAEEVTRTFAAKLFSGLEYTATLGRQAGFEMETAYTKDVLNLGVTAGPDAEAEVTFGVVRGAAAETDEDLMHEQLSHYGLDPSGYSGRIVGWSGAVGEDACQVFAVYRDGVWKTKGLFVDRARGKVDDPEEVINGFCLRILGRLVDLAGLTGGVGRRWTEETHTLKNHLEGRQHPTARRWPR